MADNDKSSKVHSDEHIEQQLEDGEASLDIVVDAEVAADEVAPVIEGIKGLGAEGAPGHEAHQHGPKAG